LNRFAIDNHRQHFPFNTRAGIRIVNNAIPAKFIFGLQIPQDVCKEFRIFTAENPHGFPATGGKGVFLLGFIEACFVDFESLFAGDIAGDLEGQTVGGIQIEGFVSVKEGLFRCAELREQVL